MVQKAHPPKHPRCMQIEWRDHFVCRDAFAFVAGVRKASIRKVERSVCLLSCNMRIHRVDLHGLAQSRLYYHLPLETVGFLLHYSEIHGLFSLVVQAVFKTVEHQGVFHRLFEVRKTVCGTSVMSAILSPCSILLAISTTGFSPSRISS